MAVALAARRSRPRCKASAQTKSAHLVAAVRSSAPWGLAVVAQILVAAAGAHGAVPLQLPRLPARACPRHLLVACQGLHILVAAAGLRLQAVTHGSSDGKPARPTYAFWWLPKAYVSLTAAAGLLLQAV